MPETNYIFMVSWKDCFVLLPHWLPKNLYANVVRPGAQCIKAKLMYTQYDTVNDVCQCCSQPNLIRWCIYVYVYIVCTLMMVIKFVQIFAFLHYNCCFRERPAKGYPIDPIQIYIHLNFYLYSYLKWRLTFSHVLVFFDLLLRYGQNWDMGKMPSREELLIKFVWPKNWRSFIEQWMFFTFTGSQVIKMWANF